MHRNEEWRKSTNVEVIPEPFVNATRAAEFLGIKPRRILEMARAGHIPAYPLGTGARRTWRFRLTDICKTIANRR
jgi:excisionase family DNA binding protein